MVTHNDQVLVDGLDGVGKNKFVPNNDTHEEAEVLRLIVNLVPSNELQEPIEGDVRTLPHLAQWNDVELLEHEILLGGAEDISCCFCVFKLPLTPEGIDAPWPLLSHQRTFAKMRQTMLAQRRAMDSKRSPNRPMQTCLQARHWPQRPLQLPHRTWCRRPIWGLLASSPQ